MGKFFEAWYKRLELEGPRRQPRFEEGDSDSDGEGGKTLWRMYLTREDNRMDEDGGGGDERDEERGSSSGNKSGNTTSKACGDGSNDASNDVSSNASGEASSKRSDKGKEGSEEEEDSSSDEETLATLAQLKAKK